MSEQQKPEQQKSDEWVHRSELTRTLDDLTVRVGTVSAAFAMTVALGLPWMRWPEVGDAEDDRLLFELTRTFTSRYEGYDATFMRVAALVAVAATVVCLVGAWRRWSPADVVLAPGLAVVVLLAALGWVDLMTAYIGSDVGVYVTLVIQLGLLALWLGASRHHRRA